MSPKFSENHSTTSLRLNGQARGRGFWVVGASFFVGQYFRKAVLGVVQCETSYRMIPVFQRFLRVLIVEGAGFGHQRPQDLRQRCVELWHRRTRMTCLGTQNI